MTKKQYQRASAIQHQLESIQRDLHLLHNLRQEDLVFKQGPSEHLCTYHTPRQIPTHIFADFKAATIAALTEKQTELQQEFQAL